ncbi:MAG: ABC transporter ATP-binding protein [Flavobacteriales bacterium]|nr:ABC transporter ATP-binding protein [Flavobacteriales bacterium]
MSNGSVVISVEDLHKRYRLGTLDAGTIGDELSAWLARARGKGDPRAPIGEEQRVGDHFWALRGVNFQVNEGEVVGLIGRNGAGKSTLLKLLSRITTPTAGRLRMRGHVASLLEVGTGFHPELTGRENIYLNGAIMGMRRAEIARKLDEIVAFSGIEHHIDTPIKRYSTGMKVRLGFAVAAHLEPQILLVDEVLAVGDVAFQRKSMGRMRSVADSGRTVIFVSHNMFSVQSLCSRAIWLDQGRIRQDGPVAEVVRDHLAEHAVRTVERTWSMQDAPGTADLRLVGVRVKGSGGQDVFRTTDELVVELELQNLTIVDEDLNIQLIVHTENDVVAFVSDMTEVLGTALWHVGPNKVSCTIPPHLLNDGEHRLSLLFQRRANRHFREDHVLRFEVLEGPRRGAWFQKWVGAVRPKLRWQR